MQTQDDASKINLQLKRRVSMKGKSSFYQIFEGINYIPYTELLMVDLDKVMNQVSSHSGDVIKKCGWRSAFSAEWISPSPKEGGNEKHTTRVKLRPAERGFNYK